ncbi:Holliday junction resolvase RuvX [Porticoccaceae bacterium]|jgi:putative holliday junction resolvase|nr:Holliday junction resolvase RuvX [Porticoccaceae bacterium]MDA9569563.1 Holliday junction resolvase RuvX [Porticoccaceae bacterium]
MPESNKHQTVIAFDYGLRQIGVAHGQTLTCSAEGISILKASDGVPNWAQTEALLLEWKPNLLLVGLPLNMDGSESELSRLARKFARRLQGRFNIEVLMVDERLTSQDAKSTLREAGLDRQSGRIDLTKIDHLAAALILQSWLDQPALGQAP